MEGQDKEMFEKLSSRTHVLERDFADFKKNERDMLKMNMELVDRLLNMQGVIEELRGQLADADKRDEEPFNELYKIIDEYAAPGATLETLLGKFSGEDDRDDNARELLLGAIRQMFDEARRVIVG